MRDQSSAETVEAGKANIAEHDAQFVGGFSNLNFDNRRIAHFYTPTETFRT